MDLTHSFTVPTAVDDAWALFMDLESVGNCFPGATVTEVTDESFSGTVKVKLGPIALVYAGSGSFVERDDVAHRAVIEAKGKDKRGNGTAGATVHLELSPDGEGTRADVVTDLSVTGKPAQFGRGVMQDVSDKLLQAFIDCVEKQLTAAPAEAATEPATETGTEPGATGSEATGAAVAGSDAAGSGVADSDAAGPADAETGPAASLAAVSVGADQPPPGDTSETHTAGTSAGSSGRLDSGSTAGTATGATAVAGGAARPAGAASARPRLVRPQEDDALDLGSAVGPVLLKRYGAIVGAGLIGLIIGCLLGRRAGRRK